MDGAGCARAFYWSVRSRSPRYAGNQPPVMPTSNDWFRHTSWSEGDEREFFARLKRARKKDQYLLIQALTLLETRDKHLAASALGLLDTLLGQGVDAVFLSSAHLARAEALVALDRLPEAVDGFRAALDARRAFPNAINYAELAFLWSVARLRREEYYEEALAAVRDFQSASDLALPVNAYQYYGALALIADDRRHTAEARRWANRAMRAASVTKGPFSRHPNFGTLDPVRVDEASHRRLWRLAAA